MRVKSANLGYPYIGDNREYKRLLEDFWKGNINAGDFFEAMAALKNSRIEKQQKIGIDLIPVGDFTYYDRMLDMVYAFEMIPERFSGKDFLSVYYDMARGKQALEMTKWFNTNYHYLVPEFSSVHPRLKHNHLLDAYKSGKELLGKDPQVMVIGPYTFVKLSKGYRSFRKAFSMIEEPYQKLLAQLVNDGATYITFEEPALSMDVEESDFKVYRKFLESLPEKVKNALNIAVYFGAPGTREVFELPVAGLFLDFTDEETFSMLGEVAPQLEFSRFGIGLINGRGVWLSDLEKNMERIERILSLLGGKVEEVFVHPSCPLNFIPVSVKYEDELPGFLKRALSFADEKLYEVFNLAKATDLIARYGLETAKREMKPIIAKNKKFLSGIEKHSGRNDKTVARRLSSLTDRDFKREPYSERKKLQQKNLSLPLFPTTLIGSFPQTKDVRQMRAKFRRGEIKERDYKDFIKRKISYAIGLQEGLGIDMLVHGEFERADMVEYFAELLNGYAITKNGWVISYGSRVVKPPIIWGDVSRKGPMTVEWITYAQSLTSKPVKGILTGPVTMMQWAFVREDIPRKEIAFQIALAIRDEVEDLEKNGIKAIQIDEPALREGLPLKKKYWKEYLEWAIDAFRLASSGVKPETQIHTHMCYSEFNDIIEYIDRMDADVISIEASRSKGEILEAFERYNYSREIGPGVYDVHSPAIPDEKSIEDILKRALKVLKPEQIWVNPDCGLKTRGWEETIPSLQNMVRVALKFRKKYSE